MGPFLLSIFVALYSPLLLSSQYGRVVVFLMFGCSVCLVVWIVAKLARGRIELYPDRLVFYSWNDQFTGQELEVPLSDIRKITVNGNRFRLGYFVRESGHPALVQLRAPVAEELYDQILQQLEDDPAIRDRVESLGTKQLKVKAKAE